MGKKLIITEKPSVARDFARVLRVSGNNNGYIENDTYVISWCFGHLVEMSYPEAYDERYKTWRLEDLPFLPKEYKYGVIKSSKNQYALVNSLLHREDIDTVYWAGDSGKEGQTIEENIRNYGGVREGMTELRVWIDSQTDDEIMRGIREARPMSDYARLGKSGIMRTIEDYSLGINFSRALSVKYGKMINDAAATSNYTAIAIGRVMTCVLGMVVNREREIRDFVETPFYRIIGSFCDAGFKGEWRAVKDSKYFESPLLYKENGFKKKESAESLIESLSGKPAYIDSVETSNSSKRAPLLFNLAELQSECSKIYKISPAQTLDVIQELYEKKLTTYPRTDARVLTTAVAKEIYKNIKGLLNYSEMASFAKNILDNRLYMGIERTSYTDDSKVTDHYAIIPTGQTQAIGALSDLQKSVYNLICKRFLSIFYPPAEYKNVKMTVVSDGERFFTSAKVLSKKGYLEVAGVYEKKESEDGDEADNSDHKEELL
ncbi:MAG: DNA topoisomerase III, partial [Lachnospiraceae bacterium]|nr:DNA topoisomerase III [Lachnospiraceae bacterium]